MLAAKAIAQAGADDPGLVQAALAGCEYDAPQGRVRIDGENNHTYLWPRVARLNAQGRFEVVWNAEAPVKPDPYRVTQTLDEWSGGAVHRSPA